MSLVTAGQLIEVHSWRYAVKKFDSTKKIPDLIWKALEKTLILAPSSYGLQPWKFLIVQDPAVRKQLTPLSWNQSQIEDCSHLVVLCRRTDITEQDIQKHIDRIVEVRGTDPSKLVGYKAGMLKDAVHGPRHSWVKEWTARQVYIAFGSFMTSAALLEVDTCPIEGIDPSGYDKVLKLEGSGYETVAACPVGYRSPDDLTQKNVKVRFEDHQIIKYI